MRFIIFIIIVCIIAALCSCTKQEIGESKYTFDRYEMVVDWYTLDTAKLLKRTTWVYDSIYKPEVKMAFDTTRDKWYIDCNMLEILQHLYYTKNGAKTWPCKYPVN